MDRAYETARSALLHFKLERCCCLAPIRVGVLIIGYFNLLIAILSLIGTADGGISPPLMEVQESFLEDNASKPAGILAYCSEFAFSIVLLCAMYRSDIVLLRTYVYFLVVQIVSAVLIYSMVIVAVSLLTKMVIIGNIVFNIYVILLVRSAIVEIRETTSNERNGHITLNTIGKFPTAHVKDLDAEAGVHKNTDKTKEPTTIDTAKELNTPKSSDTSNKNVIDTNAKSFDASNTSQAPVTHDSPKAPEATNASKIPDTSSTSKNPDTSNISAPTDTPIPPDTPSTSNTPEIPTIRKKFFGRREKSSSKVVTETKDS